ncbi:MAG TPA: hypothetical protein VGR81_11100 [Candidatus Acidoferrales bacterium]|nr:hypothetical protein [Candidatus Acidoferrales bacterium]
MAQAASTYLGEQRRRNSRIDQAVPVIVRGVDLLGQPFEERTATQNVSFHGCRYASKHHLPKNTWLTLEIPSGYGQKGPYCARVRVAWIQRPRTLRDLFQVGAEMESGGNVWGVSFPPDDWTSTADALGTPGKPEAVPAIVADQASLLTPEEEKDASLESYLANAFHASTGSASRPAKPAAELGALDSPLFDELRSQFHTQSQRAIEEARAVAEQISKDHASELHAEQKTTAQAFYEKWRQEFEKGQTDVKDQLSAELSQQLAAQIARVKQEVHENLSTTWENTIERTHAALMDWERRAERLREESRMASQEVAVQSEQRIDEKLRRQLEHLREEFAPRQSARAAEERVPAQAVAMQEQFKSEVAQTRAQWIELLESSLDSAAQRLAGRLSETSQQMVQTAEHRLASRVIELQEESGLSAEAARAALEETKTGLEREIRNAKTSLAQIQKEAAQFSDYSRHLEAASQDSLNELRQRLENSVASRIAEMEHQGAELQEQLMTRAEDLLAQANQRTVSRTIEELSAKLSPQIERASDAVYQLSAREEQAEEILRIHRERLRQVSEQVQKEAAARMAETLNELHASLAAGNKESLSKWNEELAASGAQALQQASAALEQTASEKLQAAAAQFAERLDSARSELAQAAEVHLESSRNEFARQSETAAAGFRHNLQDASSNALAIFSASLSAQAEEERAQGMAATERLTKSLEAHAETTFDDFRQRISAQTQEILAQSSQRLTAQSEASLETLRERGESNIAEWMEKQKSSSETAYNDFEGRLRATSDSQLNASLLQLDEIGRDRVESLVRTAEGAMRKACFDAFDGMARAMKENLLGAAELPESQRATLPDGDVREHRASA